MPEGKNKPENTFRDNQPTISEKGKRNFINPRKPSGSFYKTRKWVSILLLAWLFVMPLIKVNGEPLFLFNILARKFNFFGLVFWPQDFHLFVITIITFIVFIVLFTVIFGRVWCGWTCPQTVFMEMVFRRIEYRIDGNANAQRKLKNAPWNGNKVRKRVLKHSLFFAISFLIGNTFLAYIIGIDRLIEVVTSPPSQNWGGFLGVIFFSLLFYFDFAWFREQMCLIVCPYGRLQGVLLDDDSIVVAYDFVRGEPKSKLNKKNPDANQGDCIDCKLCVQVCPTGIDIRNGTQLECINCTACIDACDEVMAKINKPKRLIKFASINQITAKKKFRITPRIMAYSGVLLILFVILAFSLSGRVVIETTILRATGSLYQKNNDGSISNLYSFQVVNKTKKNIHYSFKLEKPPGEIALIGHENQVEQGGMSEGSFFIKIMPEQLDGVKTHVLIGVYIDGKRVDKQGSSFLGPGKR